MRASIAVHLFQPRSTAARNRAWAPFHTFAAASLFCRWREWSKKIPHDRLFFYARQFFPENGTFFNILRGHIQEVVHIAWLNLRSILLHCFELQHLPLAAINPQTFRSDAESEAKAAVKVHILVRLSSRSPLFYRPAIRPTLPILLLPSLSLLRAPPSSTNISAIISFIAHVLPQPVPPPPVKAAITTLPWTNKQSQLCVMQLNTFRRQVKVAVF